MIELLRALIGDFSFSGDLKKDSIALLNRHHKEVTAEHTVRVAMEAKRLAALFGQDEEAAESAGLLHDISCIISNERRLEFAEALDIEILPEERLAPFILHQKLSVILAEQIFHITDPRVLSAIGCHTTLKKGAKPIDLVLFTADKLQWDQEGTPPYLEAVQKGLEKSLKHGAFAFVRYLVSMKEELAVVHPWLLEAYEDLKRFETIRPMTIEDYPKVYELWSNTPGVGLSDADEREAIAFYLERNPGLSFVWEWNNEILGTILCGHDGRRGYIHHLTVKEAYRGQKIGSHLTATALEELLRLDIKKCHLFVFENNELGKIFWNNIGWKKREDIAIYSKNI